MTPRVTPESPKPRTWSPSQAFSSTTLCIARRGYTPCLHLELRSLLSARPTLDMCDGSTPSLPLSTNTNEHHQVRFLPASGLSAENVSKRTEGGPLSSWYDGPTLLEAIDSFQAAPRATDKPFRMCVADVTSSGKVRGRTPSVKCGTLFQGIAGRLLMQTTIMWAKSAATAGQHRLRWIGRSLVAKCSDLN